MTKKVIELVKKKVIELKDTELVTKKAIELAMKKFTGVCRTLMWSTRPDS